MLHGCGLVVWLAMAHVAGAQDFSADVVKQNGNQEFKKIYSSKNKVRFELEPRNEAMGPTALIVDETESKWILLMAQRQMYMDSMPRAMKSSALYQFWHVDDVNDACPQWKRLAEQEGTHEKWGSCTKIGPDTVNGRSTVKYEGVSSNGVKNTYWVDTKLHCVIKTDGGAGGGLELRNIQEGDQPASLFEVPAGYTKMDMGAMMKQHPQ
jgi:hypothetical protein